MSDGAKWINTHRRHTRSLYETEGESFYEDITKIDYGSMPDFDLLVGGPCCQSFSIAGNKLAFDDDRGNLFFNYIKILEVKRPRYFIAENVPNLLGISQGECFRIILEKVSELGYSLCWRVLNAAGFGVPQSRRRLFLVGYLGNRCPAEILAFGRNDEENCPEGKPLQLIDGPQGSRVYLTEGTAITQCSGSGGMGGKTGLYFIDSNPPPNLTDTARCLTTRQNSGVGTRNHIRNCHNNSNNICRRRKKQYHRNRNHNHNRRYRNKRYHNGNGNNHNHKYG